MQPEKPSKKLNRPTLLVAFLLASAILCVSPIFLTTISFASTPGFATSSASGTRVQASTFSNGSYLLVVKVTSSTRIGSVTLIITPLSLSGGKYSNVQTTTVKSSSGSLMNGVSVTMYENAGKSGGYYHGVTGPTKYPAGETVEHDTYPGAGSYTEWSSVSWNGQTVLSLKITVKVP